MDDEDRTKNASKPVSAGLARSAAASKIQRQVIQQEARTLKDAIKRVQPRHRAYVMSRAAGQSTKKSWEEHMPPVNDPAKQGHDLETRSVAVRAAIGHATEAAIRGSLMTVAQRRDYVLDRLIVETTAGGDSARIQALIALGKTANMFVDRQEVAIVGGADAIRGQIEAMLASIQGRVIDAAGAEDCLNDAIVYTERTGACAGEDSRCVNSAADPHPPPTTPVQSDP